MFLKRYSAGPWLMPMARFFPTSNSDIGINTHPLARERNALFQLALFSWIGVLSLARLSGMNIDYHNVVSVPLAVALPLIVGSFYARKRGVRLLACLCDCYQFGNLAIGPITIASYLAMHLNMPLADTLLDRLDKSLGFDWHAFISFVDGHGLLAYLLGLAYQSFAYQLMILPLIPILMGRPERAYRMMLNFAVICYMISLITIWFPAIGTYGTYGVTAESLQNINAYFGYAFLEQFHEVRNNPAFVFSISHVAGIVTFPSGHAAIAALCAWCAWPWKAFRYPALILNIGMALSAISNANHYMVDVLSGVTVTALCIALTTWLMAPKSRSEIQ